VLDNAMKEGLEGLPGDDLLVPSNADVEGVLRGDVDVLFEYKPQDDMTREELCRATEFYNPRSRGAEKLIGIFWERDRKLLYYPLGSYDGASHLHQGVHRSWLYRSVPSLRWPIFP
jgi:hypothetical protein